MDNDDEDNDNNKYENIFLRSEAKQTLVEQLALLSRASSVQF